MDAIRFGRAIRALRRRRGWRQWDLASRANTTQSTISLVECARVEEVRIGTVKRVTDALEADLVLELKWHGEGLARLLDAGNAALVEDVVGGLRGLGWLTSPEVSFAEYGERGSLDILAFHPPTRACVVIEVKSVVPDVQEMLTTIDRKQRLGAKIARGRGWEASTVSRLLVLGESRTSRRRVEAHAETFAVAFPMRGLELRAWLRSPAGPRVSALWFLSLPRNATGSQDFGGRERGSGGRERVRVARPRSGGGDSGRADGPDGVGRGRGPGRL